MAATGTRGDGGCCDDIATYGTRGLAEADGLALGSGILGGEHAAEALEFAEVTARDGGRLGGDDLFEQGLGDGLVGLVLLADALVEHLARSHLHDVGDVAAVVAACERSEALVSSGISM